MSRVGRAVAVAVVVCTGGLAACGGDDDEASTTTAPPSTRPRGLSVCGVEEAVDRIAPIGSVAGDFDGQAESALTYLDEILEVRDKGQPAPDIAADYASVTEAYEVVRAGFNEASNPDEYLAAVEEGAEATFGSREEVDRFLAAYTAWVLEHCGFDPQLGINLFRDG